jgi:DUF4097 and DUF4098 domain-containing protein YvlB
MSLRHFIPLVGLVALVALVALCAATRADAGEPHSRAQNDMKLARGSRVEIQNPNGSIMVTGGSDDTLHVVARYADSGNPATVSVSAARPGEAIEIEPGAGDDGGDGGEVELRVQLPSDATLSSVNAGSGDVRVSGMSGDVTVSASNGSVVVSGSGGAVIRSGSGDVTVENIAGTAYLETGSGDVSARGVKGDLTAKTSSGDARVENVGGSADVTLGSGSLVLAGASGFVRVAAISGDVQIDGAGKVEVRCASGNIVLSRVTGDVEAKTASGDVVYTGELLADRTYKVSSMSGDAEMRLCGTVPGFTVTLSSYSGEIETDFPLKLDRTAVVSRRLTGRYDDGRTQIQIETFSGSAKIVKCAAGPAPRRQTSND